MLIRSVHVVDDAQRCVERVNSKLVGLKLEDEVTNLAGVGDSADLSLQSFRCICIRWLVKDWKLNRSLVRTPVRSIGADPGDVVEARAPVVDDLSDENAKAFRNEKRAVVIKCILPLFVIKIGHDRILAFLEKTANLIAQVDDVLIGPLQPDSDAGERMIRWHWWRGHASL